MSYTLNIPFSEIKLYTGNARTTSKKNFSGVSSGASTRWGSDAKSETYEIVNTTTGEVTTYKTWYSTKFDVGKIQIKLDNLNLPNKLPAGTKFYIEVVSWSDWCGAGYIKGHMTFDSLPLYDTVWWTPAEGQMDLQKPLLANRFCKCSSSYGWTSESKKRSYNPKWVGSLDSSLNLIDPETGEKRDSIYIYMVDTVYNYGNPGATNFYYKDSTFKVWIDMPYTPVEDPTEVVASGDKAASGDIEVKYDDRVSISWKAPEINVNNEIKSYRLWCQPEGGEPFTFGKEIQGVEKINENGEEILTFSFISKDLLPDMVKGSRYKIGVQALAVYEELDSKVVYSNDFVSIINSAPQIIQIKTYNKLRITHDVSNITIYANCQDVDLTSTQGKEREELRCFYFVDRSGLDISNFNIDLENQKVVGEDHSYDLILGATNNSNGEYALSSITITRENGMDEDWSAYIFVADNSNESSVIKEFKIPRNTYPIITKENFSFEKGTNINSVNGERTYLKAINSIKFSLTEEDRGIINASLYFKKKDGSLILLDEQKLLYTKAVSFSKPLDFSEEIYKLGDMDKINLIIEYVDNYSDTFTTEVINSFYYPKALTSTKYVFDVIAKDSPDGVAKYYLREGTEGQDNEITFKLNVDGNDIPIDFYLYISPGKNGQQYKEIIVKTEQTHKSEKIENEKLDYVFDYGNSYKFLLKLSNIFESSNDYIILGKNAANDQIIDSFSVLPKFNITEDGGKFTFNQESWQPINPESGKEVVFSARYFNGDGYGTNSYTIQANIDGVLSTFIDKGIGSKTDWNNLLWDVEITSNNTITFSANTINAFKQLGLATNQNFNNVAYIATGINAFGVEGTPAILSGQRIITQHAPLFPKNFSLIPVINSGRQNENLFNAGDKITFGIGSIRPVDYNDVFIDSEGVETKKRTITKYRISYRFNDSEPWNILKIGEYEYLSEELAPSNTEEAIADFINYEDSDFKINPERITKISFGVAFGDDDGNWSNEYQVDKVVNGNESNNIQACRVQNPKLLIETAKTYKTKNQEEYLEINLYSSDLGGNNADGTKGGKYNFYRSQEETFKVDIKAGINPDSMKMIHSEIRNNTKLSNLNTYDFQLPEDLAKAEKIYLQATIAICINSTTLSSIKTSSSVFLLYTQSPTMAHRVHWVGINTTDKQDDEVFKISEFGEKKKIIRLVGSFKEEESEDVRDMIIEIDLGLGVISGKNTSENSESFWIDLRTGEIVNNILRSQEINSEKIESESLQAGEIVGSYIHGGHWE